MRAKVKSLTADLGAKEFLQFVKEYRKVFGDKGLGHLLRYNMCRVKPDGIYPTGRSKDGGKIKSSEITVMYKSQDVLDAEAEGKVLRFGDDVSWEHPVPIKVLQSLIINRFDELASSDEAAKKFFEEYYKVCLVTKDEAKRLDEKFKDNMPDGWKYGDDPWARYVDVGITPVKQDMTRTEPQFTFLCYQTGEGNTRTKCVVMTKSEVYSKYGVQVQRDRGIDSTSSNIEDGWVYVIKQIEDVVAC